MKFLKFIFGLILLALVYALAVCVATFLETERFTFDTNYLAETKTIAIFVGIFKYSI